MPKAYIAAPYTSKIIRIKNPPHDEIRDISYINFLEVIETSVKACGFNTFLPHRDLHQWGKKILSPEDIVNESLKELSSSDVLIAYPEKSDGVNIELGWASLLKKKIIILINERDKTSIMHKGLKGITDSRIVKFRDIMNLKQQLRDCLSNL